MGLRLEPRALAMLVNARFEEKNYTRCLKLFAESKAVSEGQALHCHVLKALSKPHTTLLNSLANMYFKCGFISDAQQVFDEMRERDVVSWNTMISGYLSFGCSWNAFSCFKLMLSCGFVPDQFSLNGVLKGCVMNSDLAGGRQVHGLLIKLGLCANAFVSNVLIELYGELDCIDRTLKVYEGLIYRDVAVINTMIGIHAKAGDIKQAFANFFSILSNSRQPTRATFVNMLGVIGGYENLTKGLQVHGMIVKYGLEDHGVVENSLVRMYCSCSSINDAWNLLLSLGSENVMSWTTLISQCTLHGCFQEAVDVFRWIYRDKVVVVDEIFLACSLGASVGSECKGLGTQIHSIIVKTGFELDRSVEAALMDMYAKFFCLEEMHKIFQQVGHYRDLLVWTTMISGYIHNGLPMEAINYFSQMLSEGIKPDAVACVSVLTGCVDLQAIEHGQIIHAHVTKSGNETSDSVQIALILLYTNCGCFNSAKNLFSKKVEYDVVSQTVLISAYVKFGKSEEALFCFTKMLREGVTPNHFTLASALTACTKLTALRTGKAIHNIVVKIGIRDNKFIGSSLVDMYSKCGAIEDAVMYFNWTQEQDVVVWNSMLAGHVHHGNGKEILKAFEEMHIHGIKPDAITFLLVLSGCSQGALSDQVIDYFNLMRDVYGISPMVEHYASVVNSLGHAGLFQKAVKFIEEMEFIPCMVILRSLLSCCVLHGCSQLGLIVVAKMIVLGGDEVSTFVLLSKLCAIDEKWGDTLKARDVIEKRLCLRKRVGASWIESNNLQFLYGSIS